MNKQKILPLTTALVLGVTSLPDLHAARNSKLDPEEQSKYVQPKPSLLPSKNHLPKSEKKDKQSKSKKKPINPQDSVDPAQKKFLKGTSYLPLPEFNQMMSTVRCSPEDLFAVTSSGFPKFLMEDELKLLQKSYSQIRGLSAVVKGGILEELPRLFQALSFYGNKKIVAVHFEDEHRRQGTKLEGSKKEAELVTYYVFIYNDDKSFTLLDKPLKLVVNFHAAEEAVPASNKSEIDLTEVDPDSQNLSSLSKPSLKEEQASEMEIPQDLITTPMEMEFVRSLLKLNVHPYAITSKGLPQFLTGDETLSLFRAPETRIEGRGSTYDYVRIRDVLGARLIVKPDLCGLKNRPLVAALFSGGERGFGTKLEGYEQDALLGTYILCYEMDNGLEPVYVPRVYLGQSGVSPLKFDVTFHFVKADNIIHPSSTNTFIVKGSPGPVKASDLRKKLQQKKSERNKN